MDFEEIRYNISKALDQVKTHQISFLLKWLDETLLKYRESTFSNSQPMKINSAQRFICPCGRSFSTEINIRETTNVDQSSPPATPMLPLKIDYKHQYHASEPIAKRARTLTIEQNNSSMNINHNHNSIIERISSASLIHAWTNNSIKTYENSPELINIDPNQTESDIELSSDESRCLEDIDNVISPNKTTMSNFIYSNDLWSNPTTTETIDENHQVQSSQQMITLKPVSNEPLSPVALVHEKDVNKSVVPIHRRPMLIAFNDSETCSPSRTTYFKCTQCYETFDSLLAGQEHANNGLCAPDATIHNLESSDSQPSPISSALFENFHEEFEETIPARLVDTKSACPVCNKVFSSVHTMIRHKTSIHDRKVRYECNICSRFFFRKDKLTSHMVYHQDFDSYVCCLCKLGFKSRMLMRQHLKRDHLIAGEDTRLNEILSSCQVKKTVQNETNVTVSYGNDRSNVDSKQSITNLTIETDRKQSTMTINNN